MMKRIVLAVAVVALGVTAVVAQSDPIAARKALMKENGRQSGIAREMIEGKQPFDLAKAKAVLANFAAVHDKGKNLWPDNSKSGGDTASLPAIWENKADFEAKLAKLSADAKAQDARREGPRQLQGGDGRGRQGLRRLPQHLSQEADNVIPDHIRRF